ncbi:MAG: hypothetical protein AB7I30_04710 [Isosphaeraceae bacterium]
MSWSGPIRLSVAADAPPMAARRGQAEREAIQSQLDVLKKSAAENRHETELLRYAADAVARGNGAWDRDRAQALAARETAGRDVADRLRALSRDLDASPAYGPLAEPARQTADLEAEAARASLERAARTDDPAQRLAELRQADARLSAVSARLDDLQRRLDALARGEADRRKLQDLADRQARLAEAVDEPLDQLDAGQNAVREELDALLRDNPGMKAAMLDAQAARAEELAKRARELADRQRIEAREATDLTPKGGLLRGLAEDQRILEEDARRLALDVDLPLVQNGRPKLDPEAFRKAIEPIARGDLVTARNRMVEAENLFRRHGRDLEETPGDLKALARRLVARQDRLIRDLDEAMGESRSLTILPDDQRAAMARALKPLADRQRQSAELASAIVESPEAKADRPQPKFPRQAAETAAESTDQAAKAIARAESPRQAGRLAVEARNALNTLANALPDHWKREEPSRRAFAEARQALNQAAQRIDRDRDETSRHLAEDPARAASELAGRLAPAAELVEKAAARLHEAALDTAPRLEAHRRRAEARALAVGSAIKAIRDQAPADPGPGPPPVPIKEWKVVGPFPPAVKPPFDPARPIPMDATYPGLGGLPVSWKDVSADAATGVVNLAEIYSNEPQRAAFAVAQVPSPRARRASLVIQSDDTLTVWVNGRVGYDFQGGRSLGHEEVKATVELVEGVNRIVVACGNVAGDWAFSVAVTPPTADGFDPSKALALREALASATLAARAGFERLEQKLNGQAPGDDLAEELAAEHAALAEADPASRRDAQRRLATALRLLHAPDALPEQAEAAQRVAESSNAPDDPAARERASAAIDALVRRLSAIDPTLPEIGNRFSMPPDDPELPITPGHATQAIELARRERRLRERLTSLLSERVDPQRDLRRRSSEIGQELADLRDRAKALSPRAAGPAKDAASLLGEQAPRAMDAAADQLASGQPDPARDAQRRAAELAERGAQRAEDLAKALRDDRPSEDMLDADADAESKHRQANPLADARDAVEEATRQLAQARRSDHPMPEPGEGQGNQPGALAQARQAMKGAAEKLQDAADQQSNGQSQGEGKGQAQGQGQKGTEPGGPANANANAEPKGRRAGVAAPTSLGALKDMIRARTGRAWGELPGHLRDEILQTSQGRYRDDYARLIQLYFREIAGAAGAEEPRP